MNTTIVIVLYAALLSAVSTTVLISLGPAAHAQTQGGCPTTTNPQGHNCQNPPVVLVLRYLLVQVHSVSIRAALTHAELTHLPRSSIINNVVKSVIIRV